MRLNPRRPNSRACLLTLLLHTASPRGCEKGIAGLLGRKQYKAFKGFPTLKRPGLNSVRPSSVHIVPPLSKGLSIASYSFGLLPRQGWLLPEAQSSELHILTFISHFVCVVGAGRGVHFFKNSNSYGRATVLFHFGRQYSGYLCPHSTFWRTAPSHPSYTSAPIFWS